MSAMKATWQNGKVVLDGHPDWPEGRALVVLELTPKGPDCLPDEDWPNSPEATADWLNWYDALEPLLFTPEEESDTETWLKKASDYALGKLGPGVEDVFR